jgi:site-specific DNA-methyltransferase (adenine-specific)
VRYLQQERSVSLDQIVCDPELASEFDGYASRLAPGFSPLQYRWVALGLRKAGRLGDEEGIIDKLPELDPFGKVDTLRLGKVPEVGGLYLFSSEDERVFLGQTDNLRHRIDRHMEISASHGLPDWLWDTKRKPLQISISGLPEITRSIRQKMEVLLVKMWKPLLNLSRVA